MLVYCGKFDSMDGPVEITEVIIDRLIRSHNDRMDAVLAKRNSEDQDELEVTKGMPPLQVDHSTSAHDTVGRCVGRLFKAPFKNSDGIEVTALMIDKIRILGKDNMERVRDGRWANLSIGADLEAGTLNEVSITPFPAAPNATILKKFASGVFDATDIWAMFFGHACSFKATSTLRNGNSAKAQFNEEEPATGFAMELENWGPFKNVKQVEINGGMWLVTADFNLSFKGSRGEISKGANMHEKLKKHLMEHEKLSEEDAEKMAAKMASHLKKMEGDDAEKKMSDMDTSQMSKLSDDVKEEDKKLAAEGADDEKEKEEKKADMAAAKSAFTKMSAGLKSARLTAKKVALSAKLSSLRSKAKITPAEIKKMDIDKLAASSDEVIAATLSAFENREDVIDPRVHGSSQAVNLAKLSKDARLARLEAETKKDMGLPLDEKEKKSLSEEAPAKAEKAEMSEEKHEEYMKHLHKMLEGYDQRDAVMSKIKEMMESQYNPVGEVKEPAQMSALAETVSQLQNNFQELVALFGKVTGTKPAELTE